MSAAEYFDFLIQIKGIGPWSIEMSRIFFIGDPDVFSILDLGLRNAHLKMFKIDSYKESFYEILDLIEAICVFFYGECLKMKMLLSELSLYIRYGFHLKKNYPLKASINNNP